MGKRARWLISVGVLGLALFGPGTWHLIHLSLLRRRLDRRLAELTAQQERLRQEEARLQSDPSYLEGLIRSTFKVARPGEYVIPLTPEND
ncbi:MAG: septum formation initiator family protein [Candidatus Omnitrophica bacterium]|nr:septum formation initiator family protein [Candidatus Omnitrophota bacterium]MBI2495649.1 septum formation initiator family protein [Candidatus Omnitrophota bacterium]